MGGAHACETQLPGSQRQGTLESRSWVAGAHLRDKIINESTHLKHKMVLYVAETAHKYKNIGQSVFKGRVCFTLRTRNVWEQTKRRDEASRQIVDFSRSDFIQSGRDAVVSRRGNKQNWEDEVVLQSLRTSEDPHKSEAHILLRVPLCTSLRDLVDGTEQSGKEERNG